MDNTEFNTLLKKVKRFFYSFALKLTRSWADAEDPVQETASRAFDYRRRFTVGTNFKAWSSTIMRNLMIYNVRSAKKRNLVEDRAISNQAMSSIMNGKLEHILDSLSKEYAVPFLMFHQGYEHQEIADHLNLPVGTVKSRIFFARKKLKSLVQSHYETSAID